LKQKISELNNSLDELLRSGGPTDKVDKKVDKIRSQIAKFEDLLIKKEKETKKYEKLYEETDYEIQ